MSIAGGRPRRTAIPVLETESLHMRAAKYLRKMIVDGELAPGSMIDEKALCAQFGTSRTPLREALKVLATEGLIELLPRRGAIVAEISVKDMREKFALVRVLEAYAARTICVSATKEQINDLVALHREVIAAHKRHDAQEYFDLNERFHKEVVALTGNKTLADVHSSLVGHLRRARFAVLSAHPEVPKFVKHHDRIVKAILNRRGDEAAEGFLVHHEAIEQETMAFFRGMGVSA
jgi:DNA-binding GntR family transcriptional regulator